jgi:peptidoglycan hydrolase-like protein with peptidoglycan-binding domain
MTFKSARFASNVRLRSAKQNNPPLRHGERGEAVAILQEALIDLAYPMPLSTSYGSHRADGIYGDETLRSVQAFQGDYGLQRDGIAGKETLDRLDEIFSSTNEIPYVAALWMIVQAGERLLRAPGTQQLIGLSYYATLMMQINQLKTALARYGLVSNPARSTTFASAQTFRSNNSLN